MTGYGRGVRHMDSTTVSVEIKSINSKGIETWLKVPGIDGEKEIELRNQIKSTFHRGRFDINIRTFYEKNKCVNPLPSDDYIAMLLKEIKRLKKKFNITGEIEINNLLQLLTFTKFDEITSPVAWKAIKGAFADAVKKLKEARKLEGEKIKNDLLLRSKKIKKIIEKILELYPVFKNKKKEEFLSRISPPVQDREEEDNIKIEQGFSMWLEKRDFSEEIERLKAHIEEFDKLVVNTEEPKGKKLDFFLQEMLRESTTLATKAADHRIVKKAVEIKAECERMREQVQNVE
jgi:uncharacterized protein (TIGR00255 family)